MASAEGTAAKTPPAQRATKQSPASRLLAFGIPAAPNAARTVGDEGMIAAAAGLDDALRSWGGGTGLADAAVQQRFVEKVKALDFTSKKLKSGEQRVTAIFNLAKAELKALGVPTVTLLIDADDSHDLGIFDQTTWKMWVNSTRVEDEPSSTDIAGVAATILHEARHAEQRFRIARLLAGRGEAAPAITKATGCPATIAEQAVKARMTGDGPEVAETTRWWDSCYGAGALERLCLTTNRDAARSALEKAWERLAALERMRGSSMWTESHERFEATVLAAEQANKAAFEEYNTVPDEVDAYAVGNAVNAAFATQ